MKSIVRHVVNNIRFFNSFRKAPLCCKMKTFACFLLVVLVGCSLAVVNADQITEPFCYWSGTAPACAGACDTGEFTASTSKFGDGKTCVTGVKRYCCTMPPQWLAQLAQSSFYVLNGGPIEPIIPAGYGH